MDGPFGPRGPPKKIGDDVYRQLLSDLNPTFPERIMHITSKAFDQKKRTFS